MKELTKKVTMFLTEKFERIDFVPSMIAEDEIAFCEKGEPANEIGFCLTSECTWNSYAHRIEGIESYPLFINLDQTIVIAECLAYLHYYYDDKFKSKRTIDGILNRFCEYSHTSKEFIIKRYPQIYDHIEELLDTYGYASNEKLMDYITDYSYNETQNRSHPDYYAEGRNYEPIDVIKDWELDFDLGNAVKYILRAGHKPGNSKKEDLQKAIDYIRHEMEDEDE